MTVELSARFKPHLDLIEQHLLSCASPELPVSLREPIRYFLSMPGKKIRPLLALSACEVVGGNSRDALSAATAIELFHDFTLIHDDIMDQDELRRGYRTMHVEYDESTAILVGDAMIGMAYRYLIQSPRPYFESVVGIFTEALVKVCEGQALDKEFEKRSEVSLEAYLDMIGKKTAWLLKIACSIGATCGGANEKQVQLLSEFGDCLGLGFQIQDDLLDFVADQSKLGKQVGSDFRMDKKTYVALKYREILLENPALQTKYPLHIPDYPTFPDFQKALYELGIVEAVQGVADQYIRQALDALGKVAPLDDHNPLYAITRFLQQRQY